MGDVIKLIVSIKIIKSNRRVMDTLKLTEPPLMIPENFSNF
ncbi:MAG: hypothetical protein QXO01_05770 [Nitrososphaerota archaeon]